MAATTALANSFKTEILIATHNFTNSTGDVFKLALIKAGMAGTFGAGTTNYSALGVDEVTGTGYTAGGVTLTNTTPALSGSTATTTFSTVSWPASTFSAAAALIYNTSKTNRAVSTHDFGGTQSVTSGTFTITFPVNDATNAIIRIA